MTTSETKRCPRCEIIKAVEDFGIADKAKGTLQSHCKSCRSRGTQLRYRTLPAKEAWARWTSSRLKVRARDEGFEYDLTWEMLMAAAPDTCPVLGAEIAYERGKVGKIQPNSPSVDRWNPNRGYTQDNITVLSNRANIIKTNATADEVMKVALWMRGEALQRKEDSSYGMDIRLRDGFASRQNDEGVDYSIGERRRRRRYRVCRSAGISAAIGGDREAA